MLHVWIRNDRNSKPFSDFVDIPGIFFSYIISWRRFYININHNFNVQKISGGYQVPDFYFLVKKHVR